MDRNMITVMTGQVVDFYDQDFRELYAISEKLDLFKEFNVSPPANVIATVRSKSGPKRPPLPATTSRFQVSLGDSRQAAIQVPAHKYYNPKYSLVFGDGPQPTRSLQETGHKRESVLPEVREATDPGRPRLASSEKMGGRSPLPSEAPSENIKKPRKRLTWKPKLSKKKSSSKLSVVSMASSPSTSPSSPLPQSPSPTETNLNEELEDSFEVILKSPSRWKIKKSSKLGPRSASAQTVDTTQDNESKFGFISFSLLIFRVPAKP